MKIRLLFVALGLALGGLSLLGGPAPVSGSMVPPPDGAARATFAGGCFWCMEKPFDTIPGVRSTTSGYAGGKVKNPTYQQVSAGVTGHAEVIQVVYDPAKVSYEELLEVFWRNIDPVDGGGQFCDRGTQYRTGVFYEDQAQKAAAEASKRRLDASGTLPRKIVTEITPLEAFYPAEDYHQNYYMRNAGHYMRYRAGCGRDRRLKELWGAAAH
jgi:peptide-methionine (S)-S-oxide reductase